MYNIIIVLYVNTVKHISKTYQNRTSLYLLKGIIAWSRWKDYFTIILPKRETCQHQYTVFGS